MKRIDIIENELIRLTAKFDVTENNRNLSLLGVDANTIGLNLGIARNSVSKELNQLHSEQKAIKIKSRPVLFLHRITFEQIINKKITKISYDDKERHQLIDLLQPNVIATDDPFTKLIGFNRSLKFAVEKGRAAILYPQPLHVLLTGPTGVGKTYFAELMHQLKQLHHKEPVPFIYFNCAEYFNNPELLSSQLFGHKQGAFTGANSNKIGLIEQANGGVLLLDEIHRLSYESQEKLFNIIDKGELTPLGSTTKIKQIKVNLICATTEDIQSNLLKTFLRRIQVIIDLPPISYRTLEERAELILFFLQTESKKINKNIEVDQALMGHFLCKPLEANIGQLKSDIQFICAQAWVIALNNSSSILRLDQTFISEPYKVSSEAKALLSRLFKDKNYLDINRIYTDELKLELITNKQLEHEDIFYAFITREYINLRNSNVSAQETSSIIKNKLKNIFDYGINYSLHNKTYIHSEEIEKRISQLVIYIESVLQFKLKDHFKNMLARHILTLLAYIQKGLIPQLYSSNLISEHCRDEYDNALLICKKIADIFYISCPTTEVVYWCLYLKECRIDQMRNHLPLDYQVIFIAHGDTTATSMANYIYRILEHELILAIDMPFEQSVHDTLHILTNLVEQYKVKKLLLIVDTGSLVYFGDVIHQKYDIDVLLVHNITMAALLDISLDLVYDSREFEQLKQLIQHKNIDYKICNTRIEQEEQVLMISCITGMGTALKIKNIIEESFHDLLAKITIKILDYNDIRSKEGSRQLFVEKPRVIGMIGTFQIGLPDIPFISLEELFSDQGPELVISLLAPQMNNEQKQIFLDKSAMKFIGALTLESIINQISVLNPKRIISEIESVYQFICQKLDITPTKQVTLRFLIHCSCMVERIVISHKPLQMVTIPNENRVNYILSVIKTAFLPIENSYSIQLSDAECFYIYELLYC